jgi:hypothetical protein
MAAANGTALVADRQSMAAGKPTALEYSTPIFGRHAVHKAVLAAAWNTFGLPGTLWHDESLPHWRESPLRHNSIGVA